MKDKLSIPYAKWIRKRINRAIADPEAAQLKVLNFLLSKGEKTRFGEDHGLKKGISPSDFANRVPIRDYEGLSPYIDRIIQGEKDVLYPGLPMYFCKTSGTTSGTKFIPITRDSMPNHIHSARNALLSYIAETGKAQFVNGKMIFLQGSPKLDKLPSGIAYGRLSGIVANHVPAYLQKNRMPSFETNCIDDWETKVEAIVDETLTQNMSLISGIPSWVQMYFERLLERSNKKTIAELFPNFSLFVYGGVNFEPYRQNFETMIGHSIPSIELYPASEGFIAYQDSQQHDGMQLVLNQGIYYEFIRADQFEQPNAPRLTIAQVELGVNYVIILNTNAGLWGYNLGDTIKFTTLHPPRIKVTGRIKHFTSAFGEHVIAEEIEHVIHHISSSFELRIKEFHMAPQITPKEGLPYHEWLLECAEGTTFDNKVLAKMDQLMCQQNVYYKDLIEGAVLQPLKVTLLKSGAFEQFMKSRGKLGGQNKVPKLSNDRNIADELTRYALK